MADMTVTSAPVQTAISVTVTRANGTVEHLGLQSYRHRNPIKQGLVEALLERGDVLDPGVVMRASVRDLLKMLMEGKN
jgi:hypothetical protein